jgi:hypothetical protein
MNEITVLPVSPAELIANWPIVGELLERALPVTMNRFLAVDVLALTIAGAAQGWLIREGETILAVMITRVEQYPRSRGLNVFALSGPRLNDYFEQAKDVIADYARRMGCQFLECQGRQGWSRVLDMEPRATFLVLDLTTDEDEDGGAMQ